MSISQAGVLMVIQEKHSAGTACTGLKIRKGPKVEAQIKGPRAHHR